jgi:tetratricopeptide (TPR) repeat protein
LFYPPRSKPGIAEAVLLFGRAMELDPDFAAPYGAAIVCYHARRAWGWVDNQERDSAEVTRLMQTAPRVARDDALTLSEIGAGVAYVLHDLPLAKWYMDQALDLNANLALAWCHSGWINLWLGHPETAVGHFQQALRRDPHASLYTIGTRQGMAHACFFLGKYDEAVSWVESELRANPDEHGAMRIGAASAACAGNVDVAQRLAKNLQSIDPAFRVSRLSAYLGPYQRPEFVAKYAEGLRMAGLPE